MDIKKAYDSISHHVLLEKLEISGVRGHALNLIKDYLTNRQQVVRIGSELSEPSKIDKGIGQGSNLGPILFNIKMNDFCNLPLHCKVIRYADDVALFFSFPPDQYDNFSDAVRHDMKIISEFHRVNGMSINPKKSKFMMIHRKSQEKKIIRRNIQIDNENELQLVPITKYLGLTINETASHDDHINELSKKLTTVVNILARIKWTIPSHILLKIYYAHFHSHLYYIPSIYGVSKKEHIEELQVLQNRALKHVFKIPALTNTIDVFQLHAKRILPVKGVIYHAIANLVNKIDKNIITTNIQLPKSTTNRSAGDFLPSKFSSDFLKRDISYHGVLIFNKLPREIKYLKSIEAFKDKVKTFLLARTAQLLNFQKFSLLDITTN